jgi:hypothetical protein
MVTVKTRDIHNCVFDMCLGRSDATLLFDLVTLEREGWGNNCVSLAGVVGFSAPRLPCGNVVWTR